MCLGRTWCKLNRHFQDWLLKREKEVSIYSEYEEQNPRKFKEKFRMDVATFYKLLRLVEPLITKQDTRMRKAIPAKVRLQVTLRYFISGSSYKALEDNFRIPECTISGIVAETSKALWTVLQPKYLQCPSTQDEWLEVARGFGIKWNYPFALG
jgi:hypothetical protein